MTQSGGEEKELATRCRKIWFDLVELRQLWQTEGWKPRGDVRNRLGMDRVAFRVIPSLPIDDLAIMAHRELNRLTESGAHPAFGLDLDTFCDPSRMHMSSEQAKPLLLIVADATPGPKEPPRAFIKMANPLVLADSLSHVHCHFGGNEMTPVRAVELLRRASVNESAGMMSIYPADLPGPKFGLMIDLIGLRLQLPSKTAISVSSDKALRPDLTAVLPLVNKCCQESSLSSLTQTELPAAMLSQRISPPRTAPGRGTRLAMPGDVDSNNPLGWPPNYPGERGRGRHRP